MVYVWGVKGVLVAIYIGEKLYHHVYFNIFLFIIGIWGGLPNWAAMCFCVWDMKVFPTGSLSLYVDL